MMYDKIDAVVSLRDSLELVNGRIADIWRFSNHPDLMTNYGASAAIEAEKYAKAAIFKVLTKERNDLIQRLARLGVTFKEQEQ